MIKGIDVILYEKTQTGTDATNRPIYSEEPVTVHNVLVNQTSASENLDTVELNGKKAVYTLCIPKTDSHEWRDSKVEFFGQTFQTFGEPLQGIDDLIPGEWNKKVQVEYYG